MAATLFEVLSSVIAPESVEIVKRLQEAKVNEKQIMISLLALNLEQAKKQDCVLSELRSLKAAFVEKGVI
jgi:hypothetical protein